MTRNTARRIDRSVQGGAGPVKCLLVYKPHQLVRYISYSMLLLVYKP